MARREGKLYVFEGPDGVGKTTLAKEFTKQCGENTIYYAFPGKVPGSIGAHIYDLHHTPKKYVDVIHNETLQFLHIVAHVDAIRHVLLPLLEEGKTIVLDRWWLSTLVYGFHADLDIVYLAEIIGLEKRMWNDYLTPDAVFIVDRTEPIDRDVNMVDWIILRNRYIGMLTYSGFYSSFADVTTLISNDNNVEDAMCSIHEYLMHSKISGNSLRLG